MAATAKEVFDRVVPEIRPDDWFVFSDGWTVHPKDAEESFSADGGMSAAPHEEGCPV